MEEEKKLETEEIWTVYEIGYLVAPGLLAEELAAEVLALKNFVQEAGGIFISEDFPKQRRLSYTIEKSVGGRRQKFDSAYFGWLKFEAKASVVLSITDWLSGRERVIRFIFIQTVRDNTLASSRIAHLSRIEAGRILPRAEIGPRPVKQEKSTPVSESELDSAIEKLVVG